MPAATDEMQRLREDLDILHTLLKQFPRDATTESKNYPPPGSIKVDVLQEMQTALQDLAITADDLERAHSREQFHRDCRWSASLAYRDAELQATRMLLNEANIRLAAEDERREAAERKCTKEHHVRVRAEERAEIAQAEAERARQEVFALQQRLGELLSEAHDVDVVQAWKTYETLWSMFADEPLSFRAIPWPTVRTPKSPEDITLDAVREFIFSDAYSPGSLKQKRVKKALLRWHPDRFQSRMRKITDGEREKVQRAVNLVAGYLKDLLTEL